MKKLVASVLTLVMLFSCISGFANVEPMSGTGIVNNVYSCTSLKYKTEADSTFTGISDGNPKATLTQNQDGTVSVSKPTDATKSTYAYLWYGGNTANTAWKDNALSFGFDVSFDCSTKPSDETKAIFGVTPGSNIAKEKTEGSGKTSWHFYADNSPGMNVYYADGKMKLGSVEMDQNTTYTIKVYADAVDHTFVTTVTDQNGTEQVAIADGKTHSVFEDFAKIEFPIYANTPSDFKATVGNTFVNYNDPYGLALVANNNLAVSDSGTVTVDLRVPEGYSDAKLYLDNEVVETISLESGVSDYTAIVQLPEATTAGEATLKLEAKNGETTESVTQTVTLTKDYAVAKETWDFSATSPFGFSRIGDSSSLASANSDSEAAGGYALQFESNETGNTTECDVAAFSVYKEGVYEYEYQFKPADDPNKTTLRGRFTHNTGSGSGLDLDGDEDPYHYVTKASGDKATPGKIGTATLAANTWYTLKVRVNLGKSSGTWSYILDGKVVASGNINSKNYADTTDDAGNTTEGKRSFASLRFHFANVTVRNLKMNQIVDAPTVTKVVAGYTDGGTADATATTVTSVNLNKLTFTTSDAITLGTKGAKILDANGNAISATVTASGKEITATYTSDTLSGGTYKLVVYGDATFSGNTLGLAVTKDFTLSTDSIILSPANNSTVTGDTVTVSVYAKDAGTMRICVDDVQICDDFTVTAGEIVNKPYTLTANGPKQVQVYLFSGDNVTALTSAFTVNNVGIANEAPGTGGVFKNNDYIFSASQAAGSRSGRVCFEGDFTPNNAGKDYWFEIGSATTGMWSTEDGWITLKDAIGYCKEDAETTDTRIFTADGKIYNSDKNWTANQTYHLKYVIDYNTKTYELYLDDELVAERTSTSTNDNALKQATNWYYKFRMRNTDADTKMGVANFKVYEEHTNPQIANINNVTLAEQGYYSAYTGEDDYIAIYLAQAYASLTKENITLKADGEALDMTSVDVEYDKNDKSIVLSGYQSLVKPGQILTVTIDKDATVSVPGNPSSGTIEPVDVPAGVALEANLIVVDISGGNDFAVLPLQKVNANGKGYAYCRWINAGASVDAKLILADYEEVDATTNTKRLEKASVKGVTIGDGANIGVIAGSIDGSVDRAFLWTTDSLLPLTTD